MEYPFEVERQTRGKWLKLHRDPTVTSASQVGTIMGVNDYESPVGLWRVLTGRDEAFKGNTATEIGHAVENVIAKAWKDETGRTPFNPFGQYGIVRYPKDKTIYSTLDRIVKEEDGSFAPLELKWSLNQTVWGDNDFPMAYELQLQTQMACVGAKRGYLAAVVGHSGIKIYQREFDPELWVMILKHIKTFQAYCVNDEQPPMDYHNPASQRLLDKLHPEDNGEVVAVPLDSDVTIEEIWGLTANISDLEKQKKTLQAKLKDYIGEYTYGTTAKGRKYSYKVVETSERMVKGSKYRKLNLPRKPKEV